MGDEGTHALDPTTVAQIQARLEEFRELGRRDPRPGVLEYKDWADRTFSLMNSGRRVPWSDSVASAVRFLGGFVGETDADGFYLAKNAAAQIYDHYEVLLISANESPYSSTAPNRTIAHAGGSQPGDTRHATNIFVSYRRSDSSSVAGRIVDTLMNEFGRDNVFFDVDSVPFGVDFRRHLDAMVAKCQFMVVLIGPGWLDATDERGRRLDHPDDWVRIELEAALQREIPVAPVLVDGATYPEADQLPPSLQALAYRQGGRVRNDTDFHNDMRVLINRLIGSPGSAESGTS